MSSSDESLRNLELECHYLSQALTKLKHHSPEWSFLHQQLEAAVEELEDMRQDQGIRSAHPTPPSTPYDDDDDHHSNIDWNAESEQAADYAVNDAYDENGSHGEEGGQSQRPLVDDVSYEPVFPRGGERTAVHHRRNRLKRNFMKVISTTDDDGAANGGWTKSRRKLSILSTLFVVVLLSIILIITLNKGESNSAANQETGHAPPQLFTGPCASFSMHLIPDKFGNETSWKIMRYDGVEMANIREAQEARQGIAVLAGGPYSYKKEFDSDAIGSHYEMVHATTCLPVGSYTFVLYDAKGDGICCKFGHGEYGINLSKGRVIRPLSPGSFRGTSEVTPFQVATEDIDVLPPSTAAIANDPSDASLDIISEAPKIPCASFSMHLIPDQFGNETSWKVRRYDGLEMASIIETHKFQQGIIVLAGGPYLYKKQFDHEAIGSHYEMIHATTCLPIGSYTFILYDAKGDGICCNYGRGEYGINLSKGRVIRPLSSGKFSGAGEVTPFQVTTDDIDVLPELSSPVLSSPTEDTAEIGPSDDVAPPSLDTDLEEGSCASFSMHLVPDQFGNETSWKVLQKVVEESAGEYGRVSEGGGSTSPTTYEPSYEPSYYPTASPVDRRHRKRFLREIAANSPRKVQQQQWTVVLAGGPYTYTKGFDSEAFGSHYNAIVAKTCLPIGTYKFILYDAKGDGICCYNGRGEYGINLSRGRVIRPLSPGEFLGVDEVTPFEVTADDIDDPPGSSSLSTGTITNDPSDSSSSSSSSSESSPFSSTDIGLNDPSQVSPSLVTNRPTTIINSLTSLVTVSADGTTTGRGKSYGILFDVETSPSASSLVIAGMDLYLDTYIDTHYEIWTKSGSWQDVNVANPDYFAGFRQVSHGKITGKGASDFTKIALRDFEDVEIQVGQRQAFWVTLSDNKLVFKSYEEEGISRHEMGSVVQAGKDEFKVFYGAAVRAYPLELADPVTDFWNNAGFLGRLWYKKNGR